MSGVRVPPRPFKESRDPRIGGWGKNEYRFGGYTIAGTSTSFRFRSRGARGNRLHRLVLAQNGKDGRPGDDPHAPELGQGSRGPGCGSHSQPAHQADQRPRARGRPQGRHQQQSDVLGLFDDRIASSLAMPRRWRRSFALRSIWRARSQRLRPGTRSIRGSSFPATSRAARSFPPLRAPGSMMRQVRSPARSRTRAASLRAKSNATTTLLRANIKEGVDCRSSCDGGLSKRQHRRCVPCRRLTPD